METPALHDFLWLREAGAAFFVDLWVLTVKSDECGEQETEDWGRKLCFAYGGEAVEDKDF